MINIIDKRKCSGCGACKNICPEDCITMQLDEEGFIYPVVDSSKCIDCGLCNAVCPIEQSFTKNENYKCSYYAAYNKDEEVMKASSSGGIFWLLVQNVISQEGVVYGATLKEGFRVVHSRAETLDEAKSFRKSKYLQSDTADSYRRAKADLDSNRIVLYSGTPCQIAGLYTFLQGDYSNLITCDILCHGVPSQMVFDKYIAELNAITKDKAVSICWRDKRNGWSTVLASIQFENRSELVENSQQNLFQRGFQRSLFLRPSCYSCPFAILPRLGDVSLGDFWRYDGQLTETNNDMGLSLVIVSSDKGQSLFNVVKNYSCYHEVSEDYVKQRSPSSHNPPPFNNHRNAFFRAIPTSDFQQLTRKYLRSSLVRRIYKKAVRVLKSAWRKTPHD